MRMIKPAKHSLRLRTAASTVSSQQAKMRAWAVRTFPLVPADAPREELAVGPIEFGVLVRCQTPRGAPVQEGLHKFGLE